MILKYKKYNLILSPITEDEMIAGFLKAELHSKRFGSRILEALDQLKCSEDILLKPKLNDGYENNIRRSILEITRKYVSRKDLFEGFPRDVIWYRSSVTPEFLLNEVMYIDYDYWTELTINSRLPKMAVKKIENNEKVFNQPYDNFLQASETFKKDKKFEEIIIVTNTSKFVVLEGHLRLTVYALNQAILPKNISVIVGVSVNMESWLNF